jgi:hypothetical protein
MKTKTDILVIGGGAAGLCAAWKGASLGAEVVLLEKNPKLGIKILISGGGKCNITHGGEIDEMLRQFKPSEGRFLKHSFHSFTNTDVRRLLQENGVDTYERENGKIFPVSHKAGDVVHAFRTLLEKLHVEIRANAPVLEIQNGDSGDFAVRTVDTVVQAKTVVIAVGGNSYRKTGTTGDGYEWGKKFGHTIIPIRPALTPILLQPVPSPHWQGTPVRDCVISSESNGQTIARYHGDVLLTHFGISGPATLEVTRDTYLEFEKGNHVSVYIDFFPEDQPERVQEKVIQETRTSGAKNLLTYVEQLVPQRLAQHITDQAGLNGTKKLNQLNKQERQSLVHTLKHCSIGAVKDIPLDMGEVTAGGISLQEVNPKTMESKFQEGLFFCGEILDISGPVGGYNLQAAFSTGFVAGLSAAGKILQR